MGSFVAAVPVPDGRTLLATSGWDQTVRLWDPATGLRVGDRLTGHISWLVSVVSVPLPDGRTLVATASLDGTVRLWDPVTQAHLKSIKVATPVHAVAAYREGMIAVAMDDGFAVLSIGLV
nr:hypothetical protein [Lentzea albida]